MPKTSPRDYPFGLLMTGRIYKSSSGTKERFTGKEWDKERSAYHLGARPLMAPFGRFPSPDRYADNYPSLSPYQYAANNPVNFIDVNGDSIWIVYQDEEGNEQRLLYTQGMSIEGYSGVLLKIISILNVINTDKAGKSILSNLTGSINNYLIQQSSLGEEAGAIYNPSTRTITIDPSKSDHLSSETGKFFYQLFYTVHELYHAFEHETIGDAYADMGITTKSEGEAFDLMYSMYTRFRNVQDLGMSFRNDPIFQSWRTWKNAQIVPYYRNYMSIIYRKYKKLRWNIQYVGP